MATFVLVSCERNTIVPLAFPVDFPGFSGYESGVYRESFSVTLTSSSPDASIRYTFDTTASIDTTTSWIDYSSPLLIDASMSVRAYAYVFPANPSPVKRVDYELKVPDPVPNVSAGALDVATVDIEYTCALSGAEIRYTLDGTPPTESSALFTSGTPIALTDDEMLYAAAFYDGWTASEVVGGTYDLLNAGGITITVVMPDGTVSLSNIVSIGYGDSVNVTATPSSATSTTYAWYLNGSLVSGATDEISVGDVGSDTGLLDEGFYTLTVVVTMDGIVYSDTIDFEVTS